MPYYRRQDSDRPTFCRW